MNERGKLNTCVETEKLLALGGIWVAIETEFRACLTADPPDRSMMVMSDQTKLAFSLNEAAEATSISVVTLRRAIRKGDLRASRVGARIVIAAHELRRFVEPRSASNQ
jgi:excisionase family DNA binding protein